MEAYLFLLILIGISGISSSQWHSPQQIFTIARSSFDTSPNTFTHNGFSSRTSFPNDFQVSSSRIPFPQCVETEAAKNLFSASSIQRLFLAKLQQEESKLKQERTRNNNLRNTDILDFDAVQLRPDTLNGALVARTASKLSSDIIQQLGCDTNFTVTENIDDFLKTIPIPSNLCAFNPNANCAGLTQYRTITGVCNNIQRPYEGSSQTAYGRFLPAAYHDGVSAARWQSVLGGPLPSCREISLRMGSRPVFDTSFNNLLVGYGQFLVHDITFSTPVTDTGRTPITSCTCDSQDPTSCTVIDIPTNDPFMMGQRCMSTPASTAAFTDSTCTLGVKEQMNANSHFIDLSATYGSTKNTAHGLRMGQHGLLKFSKKPWSKFDLPPGQRDGKSCVDSTSTEKCFAGGDSRIMENMLLAGLQTQWLRAHNTFSKELNTLRPDWRDNDELIYEETKKILAALHQRYSYEDWLPILIGTEGARRYVGTPGALTQYDPNTPAVVFNEVATAAMRLHTLVRDLLTRCQRNGQFTDQLWLRDVSAKCHFAYDSEHNGVDSFICGAMYDYGFAGDTNYAQEIHHRLFETKKDGQVTRHDIVSINICRAREHGIPGYNSYRELCGLRRATQFEDFADTMTPESIEKLKSIYKHTDDVDLFVGSNHERPVSGGIVGSVSACLIGTQLRHLKYGDRFFYTHQGEFTSAQLQSIRKYSYACFICHTTDIERVPSNPFRPPNDSTNPLQICDQCPHFDFKPWASNGAMMG